VVTRNGSIHLARTLDSLLGQEEKPERVTIVDDGSTDDTPNILQRFERSNDIVTVFVKPDRGYDIRRVPSNINLAWSKTAVLTTEYFMISGDDSIYPPEYAATLLARMRTDKRLVVASGRPTTAGKHAQEHSPSGSGRMVRSSFWHEVGDAYPLKAGWETWLLYKASEKALRVQLYEDLTYEHARPRGAGHQFVYWGAAMGTLGYHPLYAVGRIAKNALTPTLGVKGAVTMLRGYIQSRLGSEDPFISRFDDSLRDHVKKDQVRRIRRIVATVFSPNAWIRPQATAPSRPQF